MLPHAHWHPHSRPGLKLFVVAFFAASSPQRRYYGNGVSGTTRDDQVEELGGPGAQPPKHVRALKSVDGGKMQATKSLLWILRHGARQEGLTMRPDGYVRVKDLLSNARFRSLDFPSLEKLVKEDPSQRLHLLYDPTVNNLTSTDFWWIRAKAGHSIHVQSVVSALRPNGADSESA